MSKSIELPERVYIQLSVAARSEGCTPVEWIGKRVTEQLSQGGTVYERMKPLLGSVQGNGENLSERHREVLGEILQQKHRKEHP